MSMYEIELYYSDGAIINTLTVGTAAEAASTVQLAKTYHAGHIQRIKVLKCGICIRDVELPSNNPGATQ